MSKKSKNPRMMRRCVYQICTLCCACSSIGTEQHYDLCLENQNGDPIMLEQCDREALVMGLTLHDKAQQMIQNVRQRIL